MPAYKTIVLEFLKEQHPALHEQLRSSRTLLQAVNDYATALRTTHLTWMDELTQANPGCDPSPDFERGDGAGDAGPAGGFALRVADERTKGRPAFPRRRR